MLARPEVIGATQHLPAFALASTGPGDGVLIAVHEIGDEVHDGDNVRAPDAIAQILLTA